MSNSQPTQIPYLIRTLSNLHAGAGDKSFGIIDKHVQRDHATGLPTVYSSSIKGALREMVEYQDKKIARDIFGSDNKRGKEAVLQQGNISTNDARLISLPIRSSQELFFPATTIELLSDFLADLGGSLTGCTSHFIDKANSIEDLLKELKIPENVPTLGNPIVLGVSSKVYLEHLPATAKNIPLTGLDWLFGNRLAVLHVNDFANFAKDLPTVARNSLNNGISENLWYEEIVPREALFYTTLSAYGKPDDGKKALKDLDAKINGQKGRIQLGANATVGYGQTKWTNLNIEISAK